MWRSIGPLRTYGLLYFTAFVAHYVVSWRIARRNALEPRVWLVVSTCFLVGSVFGAKVLYDLLHGPFDWGALFSVQHYLHGGLWGGLLGYLALAVPAVMLLTRKRRAALDLVALSIPVPFVLSKLGCLLNGCCYGRACSLPWAITFPAGSRFAPGGIPLHPTQLYEVLTILIFFWVAHRLPSERWRGTMLLWFLVIFGFGRTLAEFFRGDSPRHIYLGPLTLSQLLCLGAALVSTFLLTIYAISGGNRFFRSRKCREITAAGDN
jgi:phosphatidylglycerol:prolipoprotein diacylglycerol transferase